MSTAREVLRLLPLAAAALVGLAACGEGDPFGVDPNVNEGSSRIFEVTAPDLPSAFDLFSGRRLFLGSGDVDAGSGDFFLDGASQSSDLRLRSIASLVTGETTHQLEIQDLGAVDFDGLSEVPDDGYLEAEDTTGVAAVQGHVYAIRVVRSTLGPNYAKLVIDTVGATGPGFERQFVDFRFALQVQPDNRGFED